ncbi:MAG TPA: DUF2809 domain-containing protein [Chthoniobacteraceae bacterium]|jgi:hypothetical protein|nr:DUF2809 domain-containing protein [Chthoniobacteraceae bacterium]
MRCPHPWLALRLSPLLAAGATIALGLLWRSHRLPLPPSVAKYGGDVLWALMVFFLVRAASPRLSLRAGSAVALAFCWLIELSQLCRAPWIEAIRHTRLGHLLLGSTFNPPDLLAYAAGVGLGALLTWSAIRAR